MISYSSTTDLHFLVKARRSHIMADTNWIDYDDDQVKRAFGELEVLQKRILSCDLRDASSKLVALAMLVEGDENPNFADEFKNQLFESLRRACSIDPSTATLTDIAIG